MDQLKPLIIGIAIGLIISGCIILSWNVQKTISEICTTTSEIQK